MSRSTTARLFAADRRAESTSLHMVGLSLLAVAGAVAAGLVVELIYRDPEWPALMACATGLSVTGLVLWRTTRVPVGGNSTRTALVATGVSWFAISAAGAIPFVVTGVLRWDLALFESISGLTGTGSTVLSPIEGNTHGVLFYRQMTQWVGGMGVIVLAVAVLPFLGIGGLSLMRAESPGPTSDRLSARVSDTARRLWTIYCVLTAIATVVLLLCGMTLYDAISHAATGLGTGGFSPYNDSIAHFDSAVVEAGAIFAMLLGAVKFPLFFAAFRDRDLRVFWRSAEFRVFVWLVTGATVFVAGYNFLDGMSFWTAVRTGSFNVVSLVSSCGFGTVDFTRWGAAPQLVLLFLMVSGSMAGSTSGALKIFRVQVMVKHAWREVRRVQQPRGVFPIRLGREPVPEPIVRSVLGYVMTYFVIATGGILVLSLLGADLPTSSGSVVTAMGGVGPGLGEAGPASNFLVFDRPSLVVLDVLMLVGRLEIFPLLALVLPLGMLSRRARRVRPVTPRLDRAAGRP